MKTETKLTAQLVRAGRECKAEILSLKGVKPTEQGSQTPGWPDIFVSHPYWWGWIEFKGPRTLISPIQKRVIKNLMERSTPVWVVRFLDQERDYWHFRIEDYESRMYGTFAVEDSTQKVFVELLRALTKTDAILMSVKD